MIAVISPTYNERDNISILISRLQGVLKDKEYRIIIVDDNSPDGTGQVVSKAQGSDDKIILIQRSGKLGYGTALKEGICKALSLGADRIITMDADLSHPPESIVEMLALSNDVVIGSRYVPGGQVKGWNLKRRVISATANFIAHQLTGLSAHDTTGGFRCYREKVFKKVEMDKIRSEGYSFLIEMLWRCQWQKLSIHEIPITFINRTRGKSKISSQEIWLAVKTILRLSGKRF
ncbi:MAG: polyprenol monophosphomannose synthase [Patescibacteria group bacterium]